MVNPVRVLAEQFVRRSPMTLLVFGIAISLADFLILYTAAAHGGVLYIDQGVGMLNNYGLFSTLVGNAVFFYLAKKCYDDVCSMSASKAVSDAAPIEESLVALTEKIKMQREYQFPIYLLIVIGALFWVKNVSSHLFGNPEATWGHKVFDSTDHPLSFTASRLHNVYTWMIVYPLLVHVMIYSLLQLRWAITKGAWECALAYDLLNPDQRGGFAFVDNAAITFNTVVAMIYIQITLHIETFKMNSEHIVDYLALTLLLVVINRIFMNDIYAKIKVLRLEALNKVKEKVYEDNKMSFEILKYCYERRLTASSIVNFAINPGAILVSGILKLWPVIAKKFSGA
jgi:hypothetical protein